MADLSKIDEKDPMSSLVTLLEAKGDEVLSTCAPANYKFVCEFSVEGSDRLRLYDLAEPANLLGKIQLPGIGTTGADLGRAWDQPEYSFSFASLIDPGTRYKLNLNDPELKVEKVTKPGEDAHPELADYITERVHYPSKDGTQVPMLIARKKSLLPTLDSQPKKPIPTYLYGYGGFSTPAKPVYQAANTVLLQNLGGMFVVAHVRGGGEGGDEWHRAATREKK